MARKIPEVLTMIALTLTNVKKFMSQLLRSETFDNFWFIEGEIVTFNTFSIDGAIHKAFFDSDEETEEYSYWKAVKDYCYFLIRGKTDSAELPPCFQSVPAEYGTDDPEEHPVHCSGQRTGALSEYPFRRDPPDLRDRYLI